MKWATILEFEARDAARDTRRRIDWYHVGTAVACAISAGVTLAWVYSVITIYRTFF
jgi:hypothetical protein